MEPERTRTSLPPSELGSTRPRRSRVSAALLIIAVVMSLVAGLAPHVILRVPLALFTIWGLWHARRWAYHLVLINGAVWLLVFLSIVPFLLAAPPWVLWLPWLTWVLPTTLVLTTCVLMTTEAGKAERTNWVGPR